MSETAQDNKTKREEIVFNKNSKIHPLIQKLKKQSMSHNKNIINDNELRNASPAKYNLDMNENKENEKNNCNDNMEDSVDKIIDQNRNVNLNTLSNSSNSNEN